MKERVRSINSRGSVTAVKVTKPGIIETEPGHIIVKDGLRYVLVERVYRAGFGPLHTIQRWECLDDGPQGYII